MRLTLEFNCIIFGVIQSSIGLNTCKVSQRRNLNSVAYTSQPLQHIEPWAQCHKIIYGRNLQTFVKSQSVIPSKPLQLSLMSAGNPKAYPIEVPFRCSTLCLAPSLTHKQLSANSAFYHSLSEFILLTEYFETQEKLKVALMTFKVSETET